jgi:hypothetical protein
MLHRSPPEVGSIPVGETFETGNRIAETGKSTAVVCMWHRPPTSLVLLTQGQPVFSVKNNRLWWNIGFEALF